MTLTEIFKTIRKRIKITPKERAKEKDHPSGFEPGLRHPLNNAFVLLRDEQVAEMSAGPETGILVDGPGRQVTARGSSVLLSAEHIHLSAPAGGIWFGDQRLNPLWQVGPEDSLLPPPAGQRWLWQNAPLVQNTPVSLATAFFLTGAPAPGQVPVSLATYLHPQPLLGPNEQLLNYTRNLAEFMRELAIPDEIL